MLLDINEEERDFLERFCFMQERLAFLGIIDMDMLKIVILKNKLKSLNSNLMNRKE